MVSLNKPCSILLTLCKFSDIFYPNSVFNKVKKGGEKEKKKALLNKPLLGLAVYLTLSLCTL